MEDNLIESDVDWIIAQKVKGADTSKKHIWCDYHPSNDYDEAMRLVEKYRIDLRYDPIVKASKDGLWMGGVTFIRNQIPHYYTAFSTTPTQAAMKVLAKALIDE